jgi:hypothetical protein
MESEPAFASETSLSTTHEDIVPAFFPRLTPLLAPDVMRWINHQLLRPPEPEPDHPLLGRRRHRGR